MNKNKQGKGSHITFENPISYKDLYKKLFTAVMLPSYGYKPGDTIYLYMSAQKELNRRITFNNVDKTDKTGSILVGKYKYHNFWTPTESALAFAQTITNRIKEIEKNVDGS